MGSLGYMYMYNVMLASDSANLFTGQFKFSPALAAFGRSAQYKKPISTVTAAIVKHAVQFTSFTVYEVITGVSCRVHNFG